MKKLKELVEELKRITNLSQPNIKFKDQMDVIEALEVELNREVYYPSKSEIVDKSLNEVLNELKQEEIEKNDPLIQKMDESADHTEENERALAKINEINAQQFAKQRGRKKKEVPPHDGDAQL